MRVLCVNITKPGLIAMSHMRLDKGITSKAIKRSDISSIIHMMCVKTNLVITVVGTETAFIMTLFIVAKNETIISKNTFYMLPPPNLSTVLFQNLLDGCIIMERTNKLTRSSGKQPKSIKRNCQKS